MTNQVRCSHWTKCLTTECGHWEPHFEYVEYDWDEDENDYDYSTLLYSCTDPPFEYCDRVQARVYCNSAFVDRGILPSWEV